MASLVEVVSDKSRRRQVVDACVQLIDDEVGSTEDVFALLLLCGMTLLVRSIIPLAGHEAMLNNLFLFDHSHGVVPSNGSLPPRQIDHRLQLTTLIRLVQLSFYYY